jgi:invasion protein IalB
MNIYPTVDGDKLHYVAWAICRKDGGAAEITMDANKAAVWKRGGHIVVTLAGTREAPADVRQSTLAV